MLRTRVIPCLLLQGQGLVKTVKFKDPKYIGDPINAIKIFNDMEVDELILLDITASIEGRQPNFKMIEEVASECFMPLAYGGGVCTVDEVRRILQMGVEKVVLNTAAIRHPDLVRRTSAEFGAQSIVVSMDVKKKLFGGYKVMCERGTRSAGLDPVQYARQLEEYGAGEVLVNSIDRDGTMSGYDLSLTYRISQSVSIPVIASGGAGSIYHFAEAVHKGHASAVAAGSFFVFYGPHRAVLITYPHYQQLQTLLEKAE